MEINMGKIKIKLITEDINSYLNEQPKCATLVSPFNDLFQKKSYFGIEKGVPKLKKGYIKIRN